MAAMTSFHKNAQGCVLSNRIGMKVDNFSRRLHVYPSIDGVGFSMSIWRRNFN